MKAIHYGIIIGGITTGLFFLIFIHINQLNHDSMTRLNYSRALDSAVDSSFVDTIFSDNHSDSNDRAKIIDNFFRNWYERTNISFDRDEREKEKIYIPCIALIENDGVSTYGLVKTENNKYCETWSPKMRYICKEGNFIFSVTQDNYMKIFYSADKLFVTGDYWCIEGNYEAIIGQISGPWLHSFFNPGNDKLLSLNFLYSKATFERKVEDIIIETLRKQFYYSMSQYSFNAKMGYGIGIDFKVPYIGDIEWKNMARNCSVLAVFEGFTKDKQLIYDYSFTTR